MSNEVRYAALSGRLVCLADLIVISAVQLILAAFVAVYTGFLVAVTREEVRVHDAPTIAAAALLYLMTAFFGIFCLALLVDLVVTWRDWFRFRRELRAAALPRAQVVRS